jgi:hypothetical protein
MDVGDDVEAHGDGGVDDGLQLDMGSARWLLASGRGGVHLEMVRASVTFIWCWSA